MKKDLTVSAIDRQNILNNPYALDEIQRNIGVAGIEYRGETKTVTRFLAVNRYQIWNKYLVSLMFPKSISGTSNERPSSVFFPFEPSSTWQC